MTTQAVTADRVKEALESLGQQPETALQALGQMYADGVTFEDPLQKLQGKPAVMAMNRRLLQRYRTLRFHVAQAFQSGDQIFLTWTMQMCASTQFEGSTHLQLQDGLIVRHRDYWDLLGGFVDSIPVARVLYHAILKRFA